MLRRVHGEHVVGAPLWPAGAVHRRLAPLNYVGTSEHSHGKLTPFKRLVPHREEFETVFFGTRAEADQVLVATSAACTRG